MDYFYFGAIILEPCDNIIQSNLRQLPRSLTICDGMMRVQYACINSNLYRCLKYYNSTNVSMDRQILLDIIDYYYNELVNCSYEKHRITFNDMLIHIIDNNCDLKKLTTFLERFNTSEIYTYVLQEYYKHVTASMPTCQKRLILFKVYKRFQPESIVLKKRIKQLNILYTKMRSHDPNNTSKENNYKRLNELFGIKPHHHKRKKNKYSTKWSKYSDF